MYRDLIIGAGEVGSSLFRVLETKDKVFVRDKDEVFLDKIHVMHICFPYSEHFVAQVQDYIEEYGPALVIVYSSVPIGTCEEIGSYVVHSPIEGVHPQLESSFYDFTRWLGSEDDQQLAAAVRFWERFVQVEVCSSSRYTEFLKIRSTSKYGINLVWADYEKSVADDLNMPYDLVKAYDLDYNNLYGATGLNQYQRYILDPPGGIIGGHCILPNAKMLDTQYPNPMLKMIKKMRKKKDKP